MILTPQAAAVLTMMMVDGRISSVKAEAVLKCRRLASRIHELKQAGVVVAREMRKDITGQRYAEYSVVSAPVAVLLNNQY